MRNLFTILLIPILSLSLIAQDGIIGTGFTDGWTSSVGFDASFGSSRIKTLNPKGTDSQYFRLTNTGGSPQYGPNNGCTSDLEWNNPNITYLNMSVCSNFAFYIDCPNTTDNYVFKTPSASDDDFIYFRVQGAIRTVTEVASDPVNPTPSDVVTITATLDGALNTGQSVYLRWTTDGFTTSTVTQMTGSGTTYTSNIPAQLVGVMVTYYVFTSGNDMTISPSDADWFTINGNTNNGSNYTYDVVLPIKLADFNATLIDSEIQLTWTTLSESNNAIFSIEKSNDGNRFNEIGRIEGAGNSTEKIKYSFEDNDPLVGTNYYRLKQIDFDGSYSYSDVIFVENKDRANIAIYPNPVLQNLNISTNALAPVMVSIINIKGEVIYQSKYSESENIQINMEDYNDGIYLLRIADLVSDKIIYTKNILKY